MADFVPEVMERERRFVERERQPRPYGGGVPGSQPFPPGGVQPQPRSQRHAYMPPPEPVRPAPRTSPGLSALSQRLRPETRDALQGLDEMRTRTAERIRGRTPEQSAQRGYDRMVRGDLSGFEDDLGPRDEETDSIRWENFKRGLSISFNSVLTLPGRFLSETPYQPKPDELPWVPKGATPQQASLAQTWHRIGGGGSSGAISTLTALATAALAVGTAPKWVPVAAAAIGASSIGGIVFGESFIQAKRGGLSSSGATAYAFGQAGIEGATEFAENVALGLFGKAKIAPEAIRALVAKEGYGIGAQRVGQFFTGVGLGAGASAGGESLAEVAGSGLEGAVLGEGLGPGLREGVASIPDAAKGGAIWGTLAGGAGHGVVIGREWLEARTEAKEYESNKETLKKLPKDVVASVEEKGKAFVDRVRRGAEEAKKAVAEEQKKETHAANIEEERQRLVEILRRRPQPVQQPEPQPQAPPQPVPPVEPQAPAQRQPLPAPVQEPQPEALPQPQPPQPEAQPKEKLPGQEPAGLRPRPKVSAEDRAHPKFTGPRGATLSDAKTGKDVFGSGKEGNVQPELLPDTVHGLGIGEGRNFSAHDPKILNRWQQEGLTPEEANELAGILSQPEYVAPREATRVQSPLPPEPKRDSKGKVIFQQKPRAEAPARVRKRVEAKVREFLKMEKRGLVVGPQKDGEDIQAYLARAREAQVKLDEFVARRLKQPSLPRKQDKAEPTKPGSIRPRSKADTSFDRLHRQDAELVSKVGSWFDRLNRPLENPSAEDARAIQQEVSRAYKGEKKQQVADALARELKREGRPRSATSLERKRQLRAALRYFTDDVKAAEAGANLEAEQSVPVPSETGARFLVVKAPIGLTAVPTAKKSTKSLLKKKQTQGSRSIFAEIKVAPHQKSAEADPNLARTEGLAQGEVGDIVRPEDASVPTFISASELLREITDKIRKSDTQAKEKAERVFSADDLRKIAGANWDRTDLARLAKAVSQFLQDWQDEAKTKLEPGTGSLPQLSDLQEAIEGVMVVEEIAIGPGPGLEEDMVAMSETMAAERAVVSRKNETHEFPTGLRAEDPEALRDGDAVFTKDVPLAAGDPEAWSRRDHLDENGLVKAGTWLVEGNIVAGMTELVDGKIKDASLRYSGNPARVAEVSVSAPLAFKVEQARKKVQDLKAIGQDASKAEAELAYEVRSFKATMVGVKGVKELEDSRANVERTVNQTLTFRYDRELDPESMKFIMPTGVKGLPEIRKDVDMPMVGGKRARVWISDLNVLARSAFSIFVSEQDAAAARQMRVDWENKSESEKLADLHVKMLPEDEKKFAERWKKLPDEKKAELTEMLNAARKARNLKPASGEEAVEWFVRTRGAISSKDLMKIRQAIATEMRKLNEEHFNRTIFEDIPFSPDQIPPGTPAGELSAKEFGGGRLQARLDGGKNGGRLERPIDERMLEVDFPLFGLGNVFLARLQDPDRLARTQAHVKKLKIMKDETGEEFWASSWETPGSWETAIGPIAEAINNQLHRGEKSIMGFKIDDKKRIFGSEKNMTQKEVIEASMQIIVDAAGLEGPSKMTSAQFDFLTGDFNLHDPIQDMMVGLINALKVTKIKSRGVEARSPELGLYLKDMAKKVRAVRSLQLIDPDLLDSPNPAKRLKDIFKLFRSYDLKVGLGGGHSGAGIAAIESLAKIGRDLAIPDTRIFNYEKGFTEGLSAGGALKIWEYIMKESVNAPPIPNMPDGLIALWEERFVKMRQAEEDKNRKEFYELQKPSVKEQIAAKNAGYNNYLEMMTTVEEAYFARRDWFNVTFQNYLELMDLGFIPEDGQSRYLANRYLMGFRPKLDLASMAFFEYGLFNTPHVLFKQKDKRTKEKVESSTVPQYAPFNLIEGRPEKYDLAALLGAAHATWTETDAVGTEGAFRNRMIDILRDIHTPPDEAGLTREVIYFIEKAAKQKGVKNKKKFVSELLTMLDLTDRQKFVKRYVNNIQDIGGTKSFFQDLAVHSLTNDELAELRSRFKKAQETQNPKDWELFREEKARLNDIVEERVSEASMTSVISIMMKQISLTFDDAKKKRSLSVNDAADILDHSFFLHNNEIMADDRPTERVSGHTLPGAERRSSYYKTHEAIAYIYDKVGVQQGKALLDEALHMLHLRASFDQLMPIHVPTDQMRAGSFWFADETNTRLFRTGYGLDPDDARAAVAEVIRGFDRRPPTKEMVRKAKEGMKKYSDDLKAGIIQSEIGGAPAYDPERTATREGFEPRAYEDSETPTYRPKTRAEDMAEAMMNGETDNPTIHEQYLGDDQNWLKRITDILFRVMSDPTADYTREEVKEVHQLILQSGIQVSLEEVEQHLELEKSSRDTAEMVENVVNGAGRTLRHGKKPISNREVRELRLAAGLPHGSVFSMDFLHAANQPGVAGSTLASGRASVADGKDIRALDHEFVHRYSRTAEIAFAGEDGVSEVAAREINQDPVLRNALSALARTEDAEIVKELLGLAPLLSAQNATQARQREEGIAEFFALYGSRADILRKRAPKALALFNKEWSVPLRKGSTAWSQRRRWDRAFNAGNLYAQQGRERTAAANSPENERMPWFVKATRADPTERNLPGNWGWFSGWIHRNLSQDWVLGHIRKLMPPDLGHEMEMAAAEYRSAPGIVLQVLERGAIIKYDDNGVPIYRGSDSSPARVVQIAFRAEGKNKLKEGEKIGNRVGRDALTVLTRYAQQERQAKILRQHREDRESRIKYWEEYRKKMEVLQKEDPEQWRQLEQERFQEIDKWSDISDQGVPLELHGYSEAAHKADLKLLQEKYNIHRSDIQTAVDLLVQLDIDILKFEFKHGAISKMDYEYLVENPYAIGIRRIIQPSALYDKAKKAGQQQNPARTTPLRPGDQEIQEAWATLVGDIENRIIGAFRSKRQRAIIETLRVTNGGNLNGRHSAVLDPGHEFSIADKESQDLWIDAIRGGLKEDKKGILSVKVQGEVITFVGNLSRVKDNIRLANRDEIVEFLTDRFHRDALGKEDPNNLAKYVRPFNRLRQGIGDELVPFVDSEDGRQKWLLVKRADYVNALLTVEHDTLPAMLPRWNQFRVFIQESVVLHPAFAIPNAVTDSVNGAIYTRGGQIPIIDMARAFFHATTADAKRTLEDGPQLDSRNIHTVLGGKKSPIVKLLSKLVKSEEDVAMWEAFVSSGMLGSSYLASDLNMTTSEKMSRVDARFPGDGRFLTSARSVANSYRNLISRLELSTRFAEFKGVIRKGMTAREAAYWAGRISLDFRHRGAGQPAMIMRKLIPFFGAGLAALYFQIELLSELVGGRSIVPEGAQYDDIRKERHRRAKIIALKYSIAMLIGVMSFMWDWSDEERWEERNNMRPDQRYRYWRFPGTPIQIPAAFDLANFAYALPQMVLDNMSDIHGPTTALQAAVEFINRMNPLGFPVGIQQAVQLYANKDFAGNPLVSHWEKQLPTDYQYRPSTPALAKHLGWGFGVSPLHMNHVWGALGYFGRTAADFYEFLAWDNSAHGPRPFAAGISNNLVPRFKKDGRYPSAGMTHYYHYARMVREASAARLRAEKTARWGDDALLDRYNRDKGFQALVELAPMIRRTDSDLADLREFSNVVKYSPALTLGQKEEAMLAIQKEMEKKASAAIKQIKLIQE